MKNPFENAVENLDYDFFEKAVDALVDDTFETVLLMFTKIMEFLFPRNDNKWYIRKEPVHPRSHSVCDKRFNKRTSPAFHRKVPEGSCSLCKTK